jgi:hypothetical protein
MICHIVWLLMNHDLIGASNQHKYLLLHLGHGPSAVKPSLSLHLCLVLEATSSLPSPYLAILSQDLSHMNIKHLFNNFISSITCFFLNIFLLFQPWDQSSFYIVFAWNNMTLINFLLWIPSIWSSNRSSQFPLIHTFWHVKYPCWVIFQLFISYNQTDIESILHPLHLVSLQFNLFLSFLHTWLFYSSMLINTNELPIFIWLCRIQVTMQ